MKQQTKPVGEAEVTIHSSGLAPTTLPISTDMLLEDAGSGLQEMGRDDLAIPRLGILQALSPQVQPRDASYVEGAQAGDILDNIAVKAYPGEQGFAAIVVSYHKANLEWVPRNKGGGFVADHGNDPSILTQCKQVDGRFVLPYGNEISQTAEYFLLVLDGDTVRQAVISMSSTQLRHSRRLNTLMATYTIPHPNDATKRIQAPIFYRAYRFKTGPEKNDKGSWFGWVIEPAEDTLKLPNGTELYLRARNFRQQVAEGTVKVADPATKPVAEGDDVPF